MPGKITVEGQRLKRRVPRCKDAHPDIETAGAISDADVDDAIREMDLSHFHPDVAIQEKFCMVL